MSWFHRRHENAGVLWRWAWWTRFCLGCREVCIILVNSIMDLVVALLARNPISPLSTVSLGVAMNLVGISRNFKQSKNTTNFVRCEETCYWELRFCNRRGWQVSETLDCLPQNWRNRSWKGAASWIYVLIGYGYLCVNYSTLKEQVCVWPRLFTLLCFKGYINSILYIICRNLWLIMFRFKVEVLLVIIAASPLPLQVNM